MYFSFYFVWNYFDESVHVLSINNFKLMLRTRCKKLSLQKGGEEMLAE